MSAQEAAHELVKIKSNVPGTSEHFRKFSAQLKYRLSAITDVNARGKSQRLQRAMDLYFAAKTGGTWKPFAVAVLIALGEEEASVAEIMKAGRVQLEGVEKAQSIAENEGNVPDRKLLLTLGPQKPKKESAQRAQSPATTAAKLDEEEGACDRNSAKRLAGSSEPGLLASSSSSACIPDHKTNDARQINNDNSRRCSIAHFMVKRPKLEGEGVDANHSLENSSKCASSSSSTVRNGIGVGCHDESMPATSIASCTANSGFSKALDVDTLCSKDDPRAEEAENSNISSQARLDAPASEQAVPNVSASESKHEVPASEEQLKVPPRELAKLEDVTNRAPTRIKSASAVHEDQKKVPPSELAKLEDVVSKRAELDETENVQPAARTKGKARGRSKISQEDVSAKRAKTSPKEKAKSTRGKGKAKEEPAKEAEEAVGEEEAPKKKALDETCRVPGQGSDPKGHYACLSLAWNASAADIRKAYRQMVLICHPDKGGDASDFRAIVEAYTVLSNPDARAGYDGQALDSNSSSIVTEARHTATEKTQIAKDVFARMLATSEENWSRMLDGVDPFVIEVLTNEIEALLEQQKIKAESKKSKGQQIVVFAGPEDSDAEPNEESPSKASDTNYRAPGIKRKKNGTWWVQVGWRCFKVSTAEPIDSMERAVNLHIALTQARNAAMARYKRDTSDLAALGCSKKSAMLDLETCPLLDDEERLALLQEEPYIPLVFSSDTGQHPRRIQTRWTPDLKSTIHWRTLARIIQSSKEDEAFEVFAQKKLVLEKQMVDKAAAQRLDRFKLMGRAVALLRDIHSRCKSEGRLTPPPQSAAVADVEKRPLALTENSAEELQQLFQARIQALEDKMEEKMDASMNVLQEQHKKEEAILSRRIQDMEARHQTELLGLEERYKHEIAEERHKQVQESQQREKDSLREELLEAKRREQISEAMSEKLLSTLRPTPGPFTCGILRRTSEESHAESRGRQIQDAVQAAQRSFPPTRPASSWGPSSAYARGGGGIPRHFAAPVRAQAIK